MGNSTTVNDFDPDELESYFTRYPDIPKETILKQHLLSLGHWFSDAALDATAARWLFQTFQNFQVVKLPETFGTTGTN